MNKLRISICLTATLVTALYSHFLLAKKTVGEVLQSIEDKQKSSTAIPQSGAPTVPVAKENLLAIKPPSRSTLYYDEDSNDAELEKVTDQGINQLYKLTQQFRTSQRRGELWLRLAELYVEKARLIEYRLQTKFDKQTKEFKEKKIKSKPKLNLRPAQDYNRKAIQLYEWFLRDFPKDPKIDQGLFFLGYNYFELGDTKKGKYYYEHLSNEFPTSPYVDESNFALGEYYFESEQWKNSLQFYEKVSRNRRGRLYSFALYKSAWANYKMGQTVKALGQLELVIRAGRTGKMNDDDTANSGGVSRIRLASEALRDLVTFYAEAGDPKEARNYFEKVTGGKNAFAMTEKLAYRYTDTGNKEAARDLFRQLIDEKPNAPKAYDYQYQIVMMYGAGGQSSSYRKELYEWIQDYGPGSAWSKSNTNNKELIEKSRQLIETTLRNHILQVHQTAQNSHSPESQKLARDGYQLYFDTFKDSKRVDEMHFFYGELLYDMKDYSNASTEYLWVSENAPKSKYFEKAIVNAILSLEKGLPSAEEVKKMVGDSTDPVEFTDTIKSFETAALRYFDKIKKGQQTVAIKYRLASLYYYFNQFDKALPLFKEIIHDDPKSQYAEYSANLLLDIYNLKKDYAGLELAAQDILSVPGFRNSKVGDQIRTILQRTSFKKAQELEKGQDFAKSAATYEEFGNKNSHTELGVSAFYNAGVNYEKAGDLDKAAQMYAAVVVSNNPSQANLRKNSSKFLAALYEKIGQYEKAAESFERYAIDNPKDRESSDFYYNAAVIRDGMNENQMALKNYQKYFDTSRKLDRSEAVFLMAKVSERRKNLSLAISYYKQYIDLNPRNPEGVVEAFFLVASLSEKSGRQKQADEYYAKTIAVQRRLSQKTENVGVSFAAEARFKQVYKTYAELKSIRILAGPRQATNVQLKLNLLNQLKEQMKSVIKYDDGPQIVAALVTMGQAYQHMAASLYNAAVPHGLDEAGLKAYREGVDKIAKPFAEDAKANYVAALERSRKLEAYNDFVNVAVHELSALEPDKYKDYDEHAILTKLPDELTANDADSKAIQDAFSKHSESALLAAVAKVLGHDQNNFYALNMLALHYFEQDKLGLAKIILNRALKEHDSEPSLHNNLGIVYLAENNQRKALTSLKKSIEVKPDYIIGSTNLASIYLEYKDNSRALPPLESGYGLLRGDLSKNSKNAMGVANNYALALTGTGENKKAQKIYKEILQYNARNPTVLANYAILLVEKLKDRNEGTAIVNKLKFVANDPALERQADELEEKLKGLHE